MTTQPHSSDIPPGAIAIIGMAGRFPGASNVREHWRNVLSGRDCISRFADADLEDSFDRSVRDDPAYVRAHGVMDGAEAFDAGFFGMLSREADLTDPQQRIFLEIAWSAFEDAGYDPKDVKVPVGVFAGVSMNTYFLRHVVSDRGVIEEFTNQFQIGDYQRLLGAGDFVATRTASKLGLRGPAISVQTACSTSATAVSLAVQALQLFQCDMALAGGASISYPQRRGYLAEEGGMGARDGVCRPFSADACGTVFGSGAGVVLLKRLEDAIADNDPIYAVIRGVGVNNDGGASVGFTAPSAEGQADAIHQAWASAEISPATVGYIEAHGTATPLGDPIEFEGLKRAFRAGGAVGTGYCALGSVKANVGHLDAAAGVTGLITASLALFTGQLPPLTHFDRPNPEIDLESSPFFVNRETRDWPAGATPRRAGVSSFGVGGTNVHIALEQAPSSVAREAPAARGGVQVLPLSARTAGSVRRSADALAGQLREADARPVIADLADVAATLQSGRRAFSHRTYVTASGVAAAAAAFAGDLTVREAPATAPRVVFMFPGQGAQYPGMARALYDAEPEFRRWIDAGIAVIGGEASRDLLSMLVDPPGAGDIASHPINDTVHAQPALFLVEYALARLMTHRGVRPDAMIGHSVGELVAAVMSGVLGFEDALKFIVRRGQLMKDTPVGGMLSVRLSEQALADILPDTLDLAAVNAPDLTVVAGPISAIAHFEQALDAREVGHRRLHTSRAFHSRMMDRAVDGLAAFAATLDFAAPALPFVSSTTGDWAPADRVMDGAYWSAHCREPVRFAAGLRTVIAPGPCLLVEIGPGRALSTFARQGASAAETAGVIVTMPEFGAAADALQTLADATGRLWQAGVDLDWLAVRGRSGRRISLSGYAFEPERHMIEPVDIRSPVAVGAAQALPSRHSSPHLETAVKTPELSQMPQPTPSDRRLRLTSDVIDLLSDMSGAPKESLDPDATFWDLGYDSLFMGQVAQKLRRRHGVAITFRQIMSDIPTIAQVVAYLDAQIPPDPEPAAAPTVAPDPNPTPAQPIAVTSTSAPAMAAFTPAVAGGADVAVVINNQLLVMQALFEKQLQALGGQPSPAPATHAAHAVQAAVAAQPAPAAETAAPAAPTASRFKPFKRSESSAQLTERQRAYIDDLIARYLARSQDSRTRTQAYRRVLADPRTASGFSEDWKDIVYPVVAARAKGSRIWDTDGNEYIDLVNGYGQTAFGHSPDFVIEAVNLQMSEGFAIGPQSPLAGEVAQMFADVTGHERVTFCNTGSEAVMAAMRLARTVTGKDIVVCFDGDYHGQFDEVLVKPGARAGAPGALPIAPGIPRTSVSNMVVLPYGTDESMAWIRSHIDDIAAVLVEPVQSRHPSLQPRAFVEALRELTAANDSALIIDEVVTGFRAGPAGMQGVWGVQADMATYGKVVGGGLPVGVLAGTSRFMDALDGGHWQYGDASVPEVAPTFFAGTFVRHPLVLAAMKAVLSHLPALGAELYDVLPRKTAALVERLNRRLEQAGVRVRAETYASWFFLNMGSEGRLGSLFYAHMRLLGIHIIEGYPCFLTTAHTDADFEAIETAFAASLDALCAANILGDGGAQPAAGQASPLTEPQAEIWMAAQLGDEASMAFNESFRLELAGPLDVAAFERGLMAAVERHDALRLRFSPVGDEMSAADSHGIRLEPVDARSAEDPQAVVARMADEEARTPFDLTHGPVARARLVRTGDAAWTFLFCAHHIVCDGWSVNVLLEDLKALYAADVGGQPAELDGAQSFIRFAQRQAETGLDPDARRFWCDLHASPAAPVDLPTDRPRPEIKTFRGATTSRHITAETLASLKAASARNGCSLFATLVAAVQVLFGRLSGSDDIVIAAPMAGQFIETDDAPLVGHCVNFLPLRVAFDKTAPFAGHMQAVRDHLTQASRHQNYTLGALVRDLALKRDLNRLPLTDIQFNLEKFEDVSDWSGVRARFAPNAKAFANYDLFINAIESASGLRLDCDFSTDLFDAETVQRWLGHFETLLTAIGRDAAARIDDLPVLSAEEIRWLRDGLNDTATTYGPGETVLHRILAQAARTPAAVALIDRRETLTYGELVERVRRIAARLRADGVTPGARIAIATGRTASTVATMLAAWRCGAAYVPVDASQPAARIRSILERSKAYLVVTDAASGAKVANGPLTAINLDKLLAGAADPDGDPEAPLGAATPAYVIFTSGSTGQPKGVEVPHGALANFMSSMARRPGCGAGDRIAAITTFAFDISGLELFLPLTQGGSCVIVDHDQVRTPGELSAVIQDHNVTVLQATPSMWRLMLEDGSIPARPLKMLCGGEPLGRDLADALLAKGGEVWNLYGPTETTIWSSAWHVASEGPVVIGDPIANTQLHVLDADRRLCPVGVAGDLWIGGDGLALGYVGRPDLTDAAFQTFAVEGAPPQRFYATGDRAVRLAGGQLRIVGRNDNQVKLRGFRIELEDVEAHLAGAPGVTAAAAAIRTVNGESRLVGYVVGPAGAAIDRERLAAFLGDQLPGYMVPSFWVGLDRLPMTVAGKIDRAALPTPDAPQATQAAADAAAPRTPMQEKIVAIWSDVLAMPTIDVRARLFSLGVDSIQLFRIVARMNKQGMAVDARRLMKNVSIEELAREYESNSHEVAPARPSLAKYKRQTTVG